MPSPFSSAISMTSRICSMKDSRSLSKMNSLCTWKKRVKRCSSTETKLWTEQLTIPRCLENHYYHDLCNLLRIVSIKVKLECHHLPVVCFQLTLCYSVSHIRDLQNNQSGFKQLFTNKDPETKYEWLHQFRCLRWEHLAWPLQSFRDGSGCVQIAAGGASVSVPHGDLLMWSFHHCRH